MSNKKWMIVAPIVLGFAMGAIQAQDQGPTVANMPPSLVKTVPQSGTVSVDPGLDRISVTFSKDMMDGNWSWTQISDESFPKIIGKPNYLDDKRTCVLNVELEPGKTYVTWLNSSRYGNFKDTDGRSAAPYLLVFQTRAAEAL